jgi:hypothetical protein
MSKYHVSQIQNGITITYGDFNADNPKEAAKMACGIAKEKYPQYSRKVPFKVKEYGHEPQEVMYRG